MQKTLPPRSIWIISLLAIAFVLLTGGHYHRDKLSSAVAKQRELVKQTRRSRFNKVVCFGDSLSDAGCVAARRARGFLNTAADA